MIPKISLTAAFFLIAALPMAGASNRAAPDAAPIIHQTISPRPAIVVAQVPQPDTGDAAGNDNDNDDNDNDRHSSVFMICTETEVHLSHSWQPMDPVTWTFHVDYDTGTVNGRQATIYPNLIKIGDQRPGDVEWDIDRVTQQFQGIYTITRTVRRGTCLAAVPKV